MECTTKHDALVDLSAFQRDLLWVISHENARKGLALKTDLEDYYGEHIYHGRIYQNLDKLVERNLVVKGARDERTNEYGLTETARRALEARRAWEAGGETT